jgi:FtsZ-interacting cell division protein ZipA
MALIVFLKDPKVQLLINGDWIARREWRRRRFGIFPRRMMCTLHNEQMPVMFWAENVVMVRVITEAELARTKKEAEDREETQKKAEDNRLAKVRIRPEFKVPQGRN